MASMSGVVCGPDVVEKFEEFKKSGTGDKIDFIVCKIGDKKQKIILEAAPKYGASKDLYNNAEFDEHGVPVSYKELLKLCIAGECRFAFYTFKWKQTDGPRDAIVLIQYVNDCAKDRSMKLLYPTSKSAIKSKCSGFKHCVEANDEDELDYWTIVHDISDGKAKLPTQKGGCS